MSDAPSSDERRQTPLRMLLARLVFLGLAFTTASCRNATTGNVDSMPVDTTGDTTPVIPRASDTLRIPLLDLGAGTYRGYQGGLYAGGNVPPATHASAGAAAARAILPLDTSGAPSSSGKYVMLSIGMSNSTQEFCSQSSALPCSSWSFMGRAGADPEVNQTTLAIVNGAAGGQTAATWDAPFDANYDRIRDNRLTPFGLSEKQVQIIWMKVANARPTAALPAASADAFALLTYEGNIVRALRVRYPNLRQVFVSNRIYAGYATTDLNPEPYAYESGFAAKWLVAAQISQMANAGTVTDARAGDLHYDRAPWLAWGPDLWADGLKPRSDGLTWTRSDLQNDGTHPSQSGQAKVGGLLLEFFRSSPYTRCWFLAGMTCA